MLPLPVEPSAITNMANARCTWTVHLDGCVEVEAAYYGAPPGWIGRSVSVQWDVRHVRLLNASTGQLLREHLRATRGRHRIQDQDRPKHTPLDTQQLLCRADFAGEQIGVLCRGMHREHGEHGETAVRRILGVLSLAKKYGVASRGCLRRRAGSGLLRVPLRPPLPGATSATAAELAPGRSIDPPTDRVPKLTPLRSPQPGER